MSATHAPFLNRVREIERKHQRMARGGSRIVVGRDGLLVKAPGPSRRIGLQLPLKLIAFTLLSLIAFKALVYRGIGEAQYLERLAQLDGGTPVDKVGGFLMQLDPATLWLVQQINQFVM